MATRDTVKIRQALEALDGSLLSGEIFDRFSVLPPEEGVLAGQSVASIVMEKLGILSGGPMNDADVFFDGHGPVGQLRHAARRCEAPPWGRDRNKLSSLAGRATQIKVSFDDPYSVMRSMIKAGYLLDGTDRVGALNRIFYHRHSNHFAYRDILPQSETQMILAGFDFNCVRVGIDLATGRLEWSEAFEEFLGDFQLKVLGVATPFHTAARYFRKKRELGCHGDDALAMATCLLPSEGFLMSDSAAFARSNSPLCAFRFGGKMREEAQKMECELSPWFRIERLPFRAEIWTMSPTFTDRPDILSTVRSMAANFAELSGDKNAARKLEKGEPASVRGTCDELLIGAAPRIAQRIVLAQSPKEEKRRERVGRILGESKAGRRLLACDQIGPEAWLGKQDVSEQGLAALRSLIDAHGSYVGLLWNFPLEQQVKIASRIRSHEQLHGPKVHGWIESSLAHRPDAEEILNNFDSLDAFVANAAMEGNRPLVAPLDLTAFSRLALRMSERLLGITFLELTTPAALDAEGRAMRHCVGGYAGAVEAGRSRILKVDGPAKDDRSTFEWNMSDEARRQGRSLRNPDEERKKTNVDDPAEQGPRLVQHLAFANSEPAASSRAAVKMLTDSFGLPPDKAIYPIARQVALAYANDAIPLERQRKARAFLTAVARRCEKLGRSASGLRMTIAEALAEGHGQALESESDQSPRP